MSEWYGDNPYYILITAQDGNLRLDLDEPRWATTFADWMRLPGRWHLVEKASGMIVMSIAVAEGDQPYYTARTVGKVGSGGSNQTRAYGIGKKMGNGEMVRLWVMANGVVVGGEDCDVFGIDIVVAEGPRPIE